MIDKETVELALEASKDLCTEFALAKVQEILSQALEHSTEQEPVAFINVEERKLEWAKYMSWGTPTVVNLPKIPLYTQPQEAAPRKQLWIDPTDKTQKRFLPNIGESILFCHEGNTYSGYHNGGSFQCGHGPTTLYLNTWRCHWMPLPAAHQITGEKE